LAFYLVGILFLALSFCGKFFWKFCLLFFFAFLPLELSAKNFFYLWSNEKEWWKQINYTFVSLDPTKGYLLCMIRIARITKFSHRAQHVIWPKIINLAPEKNLNDLNLYFNILFILQFWFFVIYYYLSIWNIKNINNVWFERALEFHILVNTGTTSIKTYSFFRRPISNERHLDIDSI
jgi:hypothetical protein